ncbi:MAG: carbohydrate binding domain-containing protein, partial [Anaerolineales bacterium]
TSERFEYLFKDNFTGWRAMALPWTRFTRRTTWQPAGAPNNGLTLTQVWGYSFAPLNGSGTFEIDQILLRTAALAAAAPLDSGPSMPEPTQPAPAATELASSVPASASLVLADFESPGAAISLFRDANSSISAQAVSPGQAGSSALQVDASVAPGGWAGVQMLYAAAADWSRYKNFDFWFYGSNTGNPMRLEIFDNRHAGSTADTSERYEYRFTDDVSGWKHYTLPWSSFSRRSDWQPGGAPNDGLSLSQVWGFNVSVISGSGRFQIDEVKLTAP